VLTVLSGVILSLSDGLFEELLFIGFSSSVSFGRSELSDVKHSGLENDKSGCSVKEYLIKFDLTTFYFSGFKCIFTKIGIRVKQSVLKIFSFAFLVFKVDLK
jgi:hypothetical protein